MITIKPVSKRVIFLNTGLKLFAEFLSAYEALWKLLLWSGLLSEVGGKKKSHKWSWIPK